MAEGCLAPSWLGHDRNISTPTDIVERGACLAFATMQQNQHKFFLLSTMKMHGGVKEGLSELQSILGVAATWS